MSVASVDEYLSALEKCKLLAVEQFARAQGLATEASAADALARALARENLLSRWQAGTLLALGERAQLRLGKYRLLDRLGKGGAGTVFLAEHVTMNRRVALKFVPRSIAEDRASLDRFFAEARAIAALDHPNIVQAYSVDNEMDRYFIVMEYIDGEDLQRTVENQGRIAFDCAADYIRQAAEGLAHAHARNLVHCDIKPSNLLVNRQGLVKILDLGLARLNQSDDANGPAEPLFGTVDYMAPEQGLGKFDHRADIYSLGCTLYFLLTAHAPFPEGTLAQRIVKHQTQQPRGIAWERPDTPPRLAEICGRMMAKQPDGRYPSMREVSAELASLCGGIDQGRLPAPRAVIAGPIAEAASNENEGDEDWLAAITRQAGDTSASGGIFLSAGASGSMRNRERSARPSGKIRSVGRRDAAGSAAEVGTVGVGTVLTWFNSPQRVVLGIFGGMALAAILALAATLLQPSLPPNRPDEAMQANAGAKPRPLENEVPRPDDSSSLKKPAPSSAAPVNPPTTTSPEKAGASAIETQTPASQSPVAATVVSPVISDLRPGPRSSGVSGNGADQPPEASAASAASHAAVEPIEIAKEIALDGLSAAADLPGNRDATSAVSLGKLEAAAKIALEIRLLGGETIAKGNPRFDLLKESESGKPAWSVVMSEKGRDDAHVARIYLDGGQCKFQWTADARERASLVRYCGLQFVSGNEKHFTALTAPKPVPALVYDLDAAVNRPRPISRDFALPEPSMLRMQILPLDKSVPKHEIMLLDKGHPVRGTRKAPEITAGDTIAAKGRALVILTKDKTPQVTLQVSFEPRGKEVAFSLDSTCDVAGETMPFTAAEIQRRAAGIATLLMMAENPPKKSRNPPPPAMVQAAKSAASEFKALDTLLVQLHRQVSIPFCIYVPTGPAEDNAAARIVIFQSEDNGPQRATGPRKGAKRFAPQ